MTSRRQVSPKKFLLAAFLVCWSLNLASSEPEHSDARPLQTPGDTHPYVAVSNGSRNSPSVFAGDLTENDNEESINQLHEEETLRFLDLDARNSFNVPTSSKQWSTDSAVPSSNVRARDSSAASSEAPPNDAAQGISDVLTDPAENQDSDNMLRQLLDTLLEKVPTKIPRHQNLSEVNNKQNISQSAGTMQSEAEFQFPAWPSQISSLGPRPEVAIANSYPDSEPRQSNAFYYDLNEPQTRTQQSDNPVIPLPPPPSSSSSSPLRIDQRPETPNTGYYALYDQQITYRESSPPDIRRNPVLPNLVPRPPSHRSPHRSPRPLPRPVPRPALDDQSQQSEKPATSSPLPSLVGPETINRGYDAYYDRQSGPLVKIRGEIDPSQDQQSEKKAISPSSLLFIVRDPVVPSFPRPAHDLRTSSSLPSRPQVAIPAPYHQLQNGRRLAQEYPSKVVVKKPLGYPLVPKQPTVEVPGIPPYRENQKERPARLTYYGEPHSPVYQIRPGIRFQTNPPYDWPEQIFSPPKLRNEFEVQNAFGYPVHHIPPNINRRNDYVRPEHLLKKYYRLDWNSSTLPLQQTFTVKEPDRFQQRLVDANEFEREYFETIYVPNTLTDLSKAEEVLNDDIDTGWCNPCNSRYNAGVYPSKNDWFERFLECDQKLYCSQLKEMIRKPCPGNKPALNFCNPCNRSRKQVSTLDPETKFREIRLTYEKIRKQHQTFYDKYNNRYEIVSLSDKNKEFDHCHGDVTPPGYDLREMYRYY